MDRSERDMLFAWVSEYGAPGNMGPFYPVECLGPVLVRISKVQTITCFGMRMDTGEYRGSCE